jgi:phage baseplate assembly protein W
VVSREDIVKESGVRPHDDRRIARSALVTPVVHRSRTVLINLNSGQRVTLDPMGSRVWELLADHPTLPALLERLRGSVTPADGYTEDVVRLLTRWQSAGLIEWK